MEERQTLTTTLMHSQTLPSSLTIIEAEAEGKTRPQDTGTAGDIAKSLRQQLQALL